MAQLIINAVVVGCVTLTFNALWYYGFARRETARDKAVSALAAKVDDLEKQELKQIDDRLVAGAKSRKDMHEHMRDQLVSKRDCAAQQAQTRRELDKIDKQLSGVSAQIRDIGVKVGKTSALVGLIADHMNLSIG